MNFHIPIQQTYLYILLHILYLLLINTFGTGVVSDEKIEKLVLKHFDLTPYGIIASLDLLRPIYFPTSCYGHFGREDVVFPWEKLGKKDALEQDSYVLNAKSRVSAL